MASRQPRLLPTVLHTPQMDTAYPLRDVDDLQAGRRSITPKLQRGYERFRPLQREQQTARADGMVLRQQPPVPTFARLSSPATAGHEVDGEEYRLAVRARGDPGPTPTTRKFWEAGHAVEETARQRQREEAAARWRCPDVDFYSESSQLDSDADWNDGDLYSGR